MNSDNDLDSGLDKLYQDYSTINAKNLDHYNPLEVAAVLLAQAISIYRTVLDDDDYNKMVDDISRLREEVKILTPEQGHYH